MKKQTIFKGFNKVYYLLRFFTMSLVTYWFISIGFPCRSKQWMQTKYKLRMRFLIKVWTLLTIIVNFLSSIHWLAAALLYMSDGTTILMRLHVLMKCFLCVSNFLNYVKVYHAFDIALIACSK